MKIRSWLISDSILAAISDPSEEDEGERKQALYRCILAFFSFFKLFLARYRAANFRDLRFNAWKLDEDEYHSSFRQTTHDDDSRTSSRGKVTARACLKPVGDLGYSGSTFFTTSNAKFMIKSLPRRFEHTFFTHELLDPYISHMRHLPHSLLVRITDMVFTPLPTLGGILGLAPTHHIIMENLLYGQGATSGAGEYWESYDLKPNDYFFPERDLAGGRLAPQSVKDKLIDEFPDKIKVTEQQRQQLLETLGNDTQLLADHNAIDYSLFLVRYPGPNHPSWQGGDDDDTNDAASDSGLISRAGGALGGVPVVSSDANSWRTGILDVEGRWTYRVVVLDFFWARHKFQARAMTSLVKLFNKLAHKGPMSITADPPEYRQRFLGMVEDIVVIARV
ncbi:hypothetical protein GGTG_07380 [Gaeumannomyces tritici R3-111a-1]|uniref:PIPK domain-containing protein n=1 Tax=Gaeumannomyces tritici (strain R3-111a-1) TaxID=644352 RepID=J3P1I3_GAET3|nr:hypothetical protein GGTG_07380 [Gaeumannomyces tritici R3-111a-1]EJT77468.1 hypothetical protein GGTG_07380 [Gaeumannomyces tritici R3-111a-1]